MSDDANLLAELAEMRREVAELRRLLLAVAMVTGYFHRDADLRDQWKREAGYSD